MNRSQKIKRLLSRKKPKIKLSEAEREVNAITPMFTLTRPPTRGPLIYEATPQLAACDREEKT
mgnify:CR=1 FL=1